MALTDPQVITVSGSQKSMPRILDSGLVSTYELADGTFRLEVKHITAKRGGKERRKALVVFTQTAIVADPVTSVNDSEFASVSFQMDVPKFGFTSAQMQALNTGFQTWLTTTMVNQLFGREH